MRKTTEKDPFQEYDKFWDELDKAEEIKNDEDYFKDKKINSFSDLSRTERDKFRHNRMIDKFFFVSSVIFVLGFFMMFVMMSRNTAVTARSVFSSSILFFIFISIVLSVLKKLKYK